MVKVTQLVRDGTMLGIYWKDIGLFTELIRSWEKEAGSIVEPLYV